MTTACLAASLLGISVAVGASGDTSGNPNGGRAPEEEEFLEELDEVLVRGARRIRDRSALRSWLARLSGEFAYEGHVDLVGEPAERLVHGVGRCVTFGPEQSAGLQCAIHVEWSARRDEGSLEMSGGVSTLAPAMIMYGVDYNYLGIRHIQVDNRGVAEGGLGYLRGNTLTTTTPCAEWPGDCRRISRITAQPDGRLIEMQVDIERNGSLVSRQAFVVRRMRSDRAE